VAKKPPDLDQDQPGQKKSASAALAVPDRNDEYFLYQTLIGAWPFSDAEYPEFIERIKSYIVKAVREAKFHTAWLNPTLSMKTLTSPSRRKSWPPRKPTPF